LNHVNCFLAKGSNGYTILDTGLHNETTQRVWKAVLADKQVANIIISHLHPDHSGFAGKLQQWTNAPLAMSKIDAEAMERIWTEHSVPFLLEDYKRAAVPEEIKRAIMENIESFRDLVQPFPKVDSYLEEGDQIEFGSEEYEVIHTPGHSAGLVTF